MDSVGSTPPSSTLPCMLQVRVGGPTTDRRGRVHGSPARFVAWKYSAGGLPVDFQYGRPSRRRRALLIVVGRFPRHLRSHRSVMSAAAHRTSQATTSSTWRGATTTDAAPRRQPVRSSPSVVRLDAEHEAHLARRVQRRSRDRDAPVRPRNHRRERVEAVRVRQRRVDAGLAEQFVVRSRRTVEDAQDFGEPAALLVVHGRDRGVRQRRRPRRSPARRCRPGTSRSDRSTS